MLAMLAMATSLIAQPGHAGPVEASFAVHGGRGQIERLLDDWSGSGVIQRTGRGNPISGVAQCVEPRHPRTIDVPCIRRLIGQRGRGPATVAIIAVDSGRRHVVYNVSCIGPDGVGEAQLNPNAGPFSPHSGLRHRARSALAVCVSSALRGSVAATARVQPVPPSPSAAAFLIEAPGSEVDRQGLNRLLFESWRSRAGVRPLEQRGPLSNWSSCMTGKPARLDPQCVQRLLPRRDDRVPVVALIVLQVRDPFYRITLHCLGARGAGSTSFIHSLANIDRGNRLSRLSNNARTSIARCINEAAPGTIIGDTW